MTHAGDGACTALSTPEYGTPQSSVAALQFYRAALVLGGAPLIAGTSILCAFAVTRNEILPALGALTVFAGLICFVIGIMCLCEYQSRSTRTGTPDRKRQRRRMAPALVVLCSNFPAAVACATIGLKLGAW